jgi:hypothetical protein
MPKHQKPKAKKQSAFKTWTQTHPGITTLLIIISIPAIIILIIAAVYSTNVALDAIERHTLAVNAEKGAIAARAEKEQSIDNAHQHKIDVLKSLGIVTLEGEAFSSKIDACGLGSTVQGWVAKDWAQYCRLGHTDLLPTTLSRDEIVSRLSSHIETSALFGEVNAGRFTKVCDELYELNHTRSLYYYTWTVGAADRSGSCGVPAPDSSVAGSIAAGWHEEVHTVRTFNAADIDKTKTYIGVFSSNTYYQSEQLGCFGFLFCEPPFELPQSGFRS